MATMEVRQACPVGASLGEGPLWSDGALWFVDIKRHQVHRFRPGGRLETWAAPDQVGWIQPMADGLMLAGVGRGIHRFDPATGRFDLLLTIDVDRPGNRMNDACVDPAGRLWFGTMDDGEQAPTGQLYRSDERGVAPLVDGIAITNGPAVSTRGDVLYHCDSARGLIHVCRIDDAGEIAASRVFAGVDPDRDGAPDGPIVDAEDHLWVALNGGGCVRRYAPDGRQVAEVRLPVTKPTKIAIGGPDGRTAYVTTAAIGLSDAERADQPWAGDLLAFDAGVKGQPAFAVATLPIVTTPEG